jgi:hypothetical protein
MKAGNPGAETNLAAVDISPLPRTVHSIGNYNVFLPSALAFAHRAFASCARRLRAAALTFRLGLDAGLDAFAPRCFAHRARCAAAILALAAALLFRRLRGAAAPVVLPKSRASVPSSVSILSLMSAAWRN